MPFGLPFTKEEIAVTLAGGPGASLAYKVYQRAEDLAEAAEGVEALAMWLLGTLQYLIEHPIRATAYLTGFLAALRAGEAAAKVIGEKKGQEITE